jgi:Fur family ferric uptake transcriptional regulator
MRFSSKETLHNSGYKATTARLAILELFKKSKTPLSAQEIIDALPNSIDQATVYRTFTSLKKKGIIHQIDLRHNHAHYELTDITEHHHLICLECGKIEDVQHCNVDEIQATILRSSRHFSMIRQHTLEFYGVCKTCSRKKEITS